MGKVIIHGQGGGEIIRSKPATASQSILEGMLLAKAAGADTWSKHAVAGGRAEPIFALEGHDNIDHEATAYADGAEVAAVIGPRMVDAWLKDGETVVEGDALQSAGDGTLRKAVLNNGLKIALIAGGSAGDHTVTGIATTDRIVSVLHASTAAAIATLADLTSEFSISAANTINNALGTDTSSDQLWVIYEDASGGAEEGSIVGYADEAQAPSGANVRIKVRVR